MAVAQIASYFPIKRQKSRQLRVSAQSWPASQVKCERAKAEPVGRAAPVVVVVGVVAAAAAVAAAAGRPHGRPADGRDEAVKRATLAASNGLGGRSWRTEREARRPARSHFRPAGRLAGRAEAGYNVASRVGWLNSLAGRAPLGWPPAGPTSWSVKIYCTPANALPAESRRRRRHQVQP